MIDELEQTFYFQLNHLFKKDTEIVSFYQILKKEANILSMWDSAVLATFKTTICNHYTGGTS